MNAKIKKLRDDAVIPIRATMGAAGYDLFACFDANSVDIAPHETVKIGTGLAIQPPKNTFGAIFARSGLATKQGLRPSNCVGVCDAKGVWFILLLNVITAIKNSTVARQDFTKVKHIAVPKNVCLIFLRTKEKWTKNILIVYVQYVVKSSI